MILRLFIALTLSGAAFWAAFTQPWRRLTEKRPVLAPVKIEPVEPVPSPLPKQLTPR